MHEAKRRVCTGALPVEPPEESAGCPETVTCGGLCTTWIRCDLIRRIHATGPGPGKGYAKASDGSCCSK